MNRILVIDHAEVTTQSLELAGVHDYNGLHFGDEVRTIQPGACSTFIHLQFVTFSPDCALVEIGPLTFSNTRLEDIQLPRSLRVLGFGAFSSCEQLRVVRFEDELTTIGPLAFAHCRRLRGVLTLPPSVTSIGFSAFSQTRIHALVVAMTTHDNHTFAHALDGMQELETVVIPGATVETLAKARTVLGIGHGVSTVASVDAIQVDADPPVVSSSGLDSVHVGTGRGTPDPVQVLYIHQETVGPDDLRFTGQTHVFVGGSVRRILEGTFHNWTTVKEVTFEDTETRPSSLESIGNYAFYNNSELLALVLPTSLQQIGFSAFFNCSKLASVTLGPLLEDIGTVAFGCCALTTIEIPASVTHIRNDAFGDNTNMESMTFHAPDLSTVIFHGAIASYASSLRIVSVAPNQDPTTLLHHMVDEAKINVFRTTLLDTDGVTLDPVGHQLTALDDVGPVTPTTGTLLLSMSHDRRVQEILGRVLAQQSPQVLKSVVAAVDLPDAFTVNDPDTVEILKDLMPSALRSHPVGYVHVLPRRQRQIQVADTHAGIPEMFYLPTDEPVELILPDGTVLTVVSNSPPIQSDVCTIHCFKGSMGLLVETRPTALTDGSKDQVGSLRWAVDAYLGPDGLDAATYGHLEDWDVSQVTDMSSLFSHVPNFNGNLSAWDVGQVTDMASMFEGTTSFNRDIRNWTVANVVDMSRMFFGADLLAEHKDSFQYWEVHPDVNLSHMFDEAETPPLSFFVNHPGPVAVAGGDPYIYPLVGPAVKLPNVDGHYRLYQDDEVVINVHVAAASPEAMRDIERLTLPVVHTGLGLTPIASEAFFFRALYVASRSTGESVTIDLDRRTTTGSTALLHVGPPEVQHHPGHAYDPDARSHVCIPVTWGRRMALTVHYSHHVQVRNGLSLRGAQLHATGLLVRNYRPKFFVVPSLTYTRSVDLPRRCIRPLVTRAPVVQGQTWIGVIDR